MKLFWTILKILLALFMIYAGIQHFLKPSFYLSFVPYFLPFKMLVIYLSGVLEIVLGVLLLLPKYAKLGATGILWLMIIFLPIHIWDVFLDQPAIGSHEAAMIRLPIQFVIIGLAWAVRKYAT
ncbi:DoxX family membrane protein [Arenibacter sp. BSSL-BM3]|uniref:DoxX family membrane protein n=1 Tax=Arenibacter arenosicollis TaxID=2762274 RepID=A0ABR7QSU8_9FLAO|nr:MauE/DoxX family redox-associated membrane protein [Arenibacter arenosicollis]MBC8770228.1 DoxX family membrane protein [Arenibacter arenosicollis]